MCHLIVNSHNTENVDLPFRFVRSNVFFKPLWPFSVLSGVCVCERESVCLYLCA